MKSLSLFVPLFSFSFAVGAAAQDANFDSQPEGGLSQSYTEGGITFFNLDKNLGSAPDPFAIENATQDLTGMPGFSAPNCLGFGGWSPGPGTGFSRVLSFDMTTGQVQNEAHLDLWDGGSYGGNTISLQARMGATIVATDTQTVPNGGFIHHYHFSVSGVSFDTLRIQGGGPSDNGVFFGVVDGVHIGTTSVGTIFCAGDGSGTACPCGNASPIGAGTGCLSSLGLGAKLRSMGLASLSNDTLELEGEQMPNAPCLYFQGTARTNGGAGSVFGDGLRCAGGSIVRLSTAINASGMSQYPTGAQPSVSVRGQVTTPGLRDYQVWYRNAAAFCTPSTFNLTNGLEITWAP
jgi:hypothetical protein